MTATIRAFVFFLIFIFVSTITIAQSNTMGTATTITPVTSCGATTSQTLYNATSDGPGSTCGTTNDVWYTFTTPSNVSSIQIAVTVGGGSNLDNTNTFIEAFNARTTAAVTAPNSLGCDDMGTGLNLTGLTPSTLYYFRVFTSATPNTTPSNKWTFSICVSYLPPPPNDDCSVAISLTSNLSCTNTSGTFNAASPSTGITTGCASIGTHYDVWYSFTATSAISQTITLSSLGANISNPEIQLYSGTCGSLTSIQCGTTTITAIGLSVGTTYYVRISNVGADPTGTGAVDDFTICITHPQPPPANDECAGATNLTIGTTNSSGTVWLATASTGIATGCAGGTPDDDVWYKFTAASTSTIVTLSSIGSNLSSSGALVQLFSGSCASLTSLACGYINLSASGLTIGSVYYIRVYSSGAGSIGGTSAGSTFSITVSTPAAVTTVNNIGGSRMNEVFLQTTIAPANTFDNPWEIIYGPDGNLWITESRGYKVYKMNPATGLKSTILDISQNSSFLPAADQGFNLQFNFAGQGNPQGGLAGMALHPDFLHPTTPKNYVYLSYIHTYVSTAASSGGVFFTNRLVRFTYNTTTGMLESPVSLCDTLPGSSDHNSQRMIIAPVGGTNYLFYAEGDMGSGQYTNLNRAIKSQNLDSYEGKILRFNLEDDGDAGLDKWIPNDNPFNSTTQSAVWSSGMRNNQGFAYGTINGTGYLYGTSHGPFSDDEVNIIERGKNYGHPLVIGYSTDGNYDGAKAGPSNGSLPAITSESANASAIGSSYKDPIFTFYSVPKGTTTTTGTIQYIYSQVNGGNGGNGAWPSEAPSGLELYTHTLIPGWKNSLVSSALKWGRLMRLKLNTAGTGISPTNGQDTVTYFESANRYRDIAFAPDGKNMFVIMDKSSATSGPSTDNPAIIGCAGCVQKYTFLGYQHNTGTSRSTIPSAIDITSGTANTVSNGTAVTIDATNNTLWVPITGPDGNIMAEIKANGNNLGLITSAFYTHSGTVREDASKRLYLNRSITISPQNQPTSTVNVRLYITSAELSALIGATNSQGQGSGVSSVGNLKILKNSDASPEALTAATANLTPVYAEAHAGTSNGGYVLQADITSFSSFYFGDPSMIPLPLELISFKGSLVNNATYLHWETSNENNTSHFIVERSIDGQNFEIIGSVAANGNSAIAKYSFTDHDADKQPASLIYYRLHMVDKDGANTYSQIISVLINSATLPVVVFPNPVNDLLNLRISLTAATQLHIQVTDMQGRLVYKKNKQGRNGTEVMKINTKSWPAQSYSIIVSDGSNKILVSKKLIKM